MEWRHFILLLFILFHFAAEGGLTNVCRLVIENIDNKNPAALNGSTPLHLAAKKGHLGIVRLIVETGVDKNCLFNGQTPLDLVNETSFRSFTFYKLLSKDKFQCFVTQAHLPLSQLAFLQF